MKILLVEPYYSGSHAAWAEGYARHSRHTVRVLALPGCFWKWRMWGGAVALARLFRSGDYHPDLILATDMLDLSAFLALTRDRTHGIPTALFFHENQLTYPLLPGRKRELDFGLINYKSALCADRLLFNSHYHLASFFDELPRLLKHFPDHNELDTVAELKARAEVLPVGLDLRRFDASDVDAIAPDRRSFSGQGTVIVWNHRWEYDKNPEEFFAALDRLDALSLPFRLILLGENFRQQPDEFVAAQERFAGRLVHFGFAEDSETYRTLLRQGDVCVSTAHHEFFGVATLEAIYAGCWPLLPDRLVYPELLPPKLHAQCLYPDFEGLVMRLERFIRGSAPTEEDRRAVRTHVAAFDWRNVAAVYDRRLSEVTQWTGDGLGERFRDGG
jgi:glycosyltransferase involved in cell wall biosynthesis